MSMTGDLLERVRMRQEECPSSDNLQQLRFCGNAREVVENRVESGYLGSGSQTMAGKKSEAAELVGDR